MLNTIKLLLGITDDSKDQLISYLLSVVKDEVINYTHNPKCLPNLTNTIVAMVVYKYNRIGTEGLSTENWSGVSYSYTDTYPSEILAQLRAYRKVRFA